MSAAQSGQRSSLPDVLACTSCGHDNSEGAKFCEDCGFSFAAAPARERELRKTVTVLFCDVAGSTALGETLDPERLRALLARYFERMKAIVESHGGSVEKFIGDAVMAVFGVPLLHEDDALRALRAAVEMRDALPELGIEGRIGVTTGEVVTGTEERLATGDAVNVAARLEQAAAPGEVLVGQPTLALVRDAAKVEPVGPLVLKGKSEPIAAYRLLEVRESPERRHEAVFVGRERELAILRQAWGRARAELRCELVTVVGDAGVGKSRLVAELVRGIEATVVRGRCLPYGKGITYWPVVEVLKQINLQPPHETAGAAIRSLLGETEATTSAEEIALAFRKTLEQAAAEQPLVVVFDDIQWGEEVLIDLIEHVALLSTGYSILLLCIARPELDERRRSWPVTLRLEPLGDADVEQLIPERVAGGLREKIARAAGGNPLFVEEMLAMADEAQREVVVPPTLQALLAARLDQLETAERSVLERGAVEGEIFHRSAVQALAPDERQVTPRLAALVRKQLIRPDKPQLPGEDAFRFRHLLIRDAAYDALPKAVRAELHERFANWLEERGAGFVVELDELLAHHLERAYGYRLELGAGDEKAQQGPGEDITRIAQRAVLALRRAGLRAMRLSANEQAVEHFSSAIALVGRLSDGDERGRMEAELQLQLGIALFALQGIGAPEPERAYGRATELMVASATTAEQFPIHFGLCLVHGLRGSFDQATLLVDSMSELASQGDESMRLQALHARWMISLFSGRIDNAVAAADEGRAIYRADAHHPLAFRYGNHDAGVCALSLQALAFALRGESVRALAQMHEAIALGESLGHAFSLVQPLTQLPWVCQINGDASAALLESERALAFENEIVNPQSFGIAHAMRGWALSSMGRDEEGVAELERALANELVASEIWAAMTAALLSEVHIRQGRHEAARALLDQMRSLTESKPACVFEPDFLRAEAQWLGLTGQVNESRRVLHQAIATALEHGSLTLAVRAALALAQTPSAQNAADLKLLSELCERLPPENNTAYRREAQALVGQPIAKTPP
jgi:class 3 adenylate cyclase/tetratricopeptide (TPR) repeat protein